MSDEAAWLVDSLLPEAPYRQWTITFPFSLRLALARDPRLLAEVFGIAIRGLFAWQRRQARRAGVLGAKTAAVLAVQRFGGALNLNVHGHAIVPDGVFVLAERRYRFVPLAAPSKDDLVALTTRLARRVTALLERRYAHRDEPPLGPVEGALAEAMRHPFLPASPVGPDTTADDEDDLRRCASVDGFALHADTAVAAADRLGLERLCRYGLRPAFSQDRLALTPDGRVQVSLRKPWPHRSGSRVLTLEPLAFLRRLAALTPPPYVHLLRHYGLFAPRAKGRERLPSPPPSPFGPRPQRLPPHSASSAAHPAPPQPPQPPCLPAPPAKASATSAALLEATSAPAPAPDARPPALDPNLPSTLPEAPSPWPGEPASRPPRTRLPWHELLRRVFAIDVLVCPRCAGPLTVLAYLTEAAVVGKILSHLGLPTRPLPIAPARSPEQLDPTLGGVDAGGAGTYATTVGLNLQKLLLMPNRHLLKLRLNFAYQYSTKVDLHGISTYGGSPTTEGYVEPGSNYLLLLAGEYQLSRRWAVALDVQWSHNGADRFFGVPGRASDGSLASVGGATANTITLAPGVELNVTGELGIILGLVWTPLAQNALTAFGPSLAIGFGI